MSNLTQRILTALVGAPLLAGAAYLGGWYFGAVVLAIALIGQHELYTMLEKAGMPSWRVFGLVLGALLAVRALWPPVLPAAVVVTLAMVAWSPFARSAQPAVRLGTTLLGAIYPAALVAFLTDLRVGRSAVVGDWEAFLLLLTLFLLIWATDILAYVVGKSFGRHALAPSISPKKTWEGAFGGAFGAIGAAVALKLTLLPFLAWPHIIAVALICGVFSQLGDLAESQIKREAGVKDSGTLLPGHGGFLDRFDAMVLAAPAMFLYLKYIAQLYA